MIKRSSVLLLALRILTVGGAILVSLMVLIIASSVNIRMRRKKIRRINLTCDPKLSVEYKLIEIGGQYNWCLDNNLTLLSRLAQVRCLPYQSY